MNKESAVNNMGNISRLEAQAFAANVLKELGLDDWCMKWTTDRSECIRDMKLLFIYSRKKRFRIYPGYPWEVKEIILHEIAHIFTLDSAHGAGFYTEYIKLLTKFMVESPL